MSIEATIFDIITLIISGRLVWKNHKNLMGNTYCIIYFIFFLFYVFPLFLDYLVSLPDYTLQARYLGFANSYLDTNTRIIYDVFLITIQFLLCRKIPQNNMPLETYCSTEMQTNSHSPILRLLLLGGMCAPVILTLILPVSKGILYTFEWRELEIFTYNSATHTIEDFSYVGILCSLLLLLQADDKGGKRSIVASLVYLVFLYMDLCTQGKRSIVFFAIVCAFIIIIPGVRNNYIENREKAKKQFKSLLLFSVLGMALMIFMTVYVKVNVRGWDANDTMDLYTMTRIDFFKDDRVRFAIYALLNPSEWTILKDIGQTVFPTITWFYPINTILAKMHIVYDSYQDYFSSALQHVVDRPFMTTSYFAELFSNFSWFGALFMYWLCSLFASMAKKVNYPAKAMILISFLALQMYTVKYLAMFFEFCIVYCLIYNAINKRRI